MPRLASLGWPLPLAGLVALSASSWLKAAGASDEACLSPPDASKGAMSHKGRGDCQSDVSLLQMRGHSVQGAERHVRGRISRHTEVHRKFGPPTAREVLKILFVGNSFTYGPNHYKTPDILNNIPRFFKFVAESLGKQVQQQEDTLGGCTLYTHRPSVSAEGRNCSDPASDCQLVNNARVSASEDCTVPKAIPEIADRYCPCPQRLTRQAFGPWDVVVVQDWSNMLTIKKARELMLHPAVEEFSRVLQHQGTELGDHYFGKPILAAYSTWAYYSGAPHTCPGGTKAGCWPYGSGNQLSNCHNSTAWFDKVSNVPCQTYALHRGSTDLLNRGADVVVPAGLAWQAARGITELPQDCKSSIDAEYDTPDPLGELELPVLANPGDAIFQGAEAMRLFRDKGPTYDSPYCTNCTIDHHPSRLAAYLNALVFYATLFGESPIGAAVPDEGTTVDGMVLPAIDPQVAEVLQRVAHKVVLGGGGAEARGDIWWKGGRHP